MANPISLPREGGSSMVQLMPSVITLALTYDTTISTSTQVTFNANTTMIRVYAISQDIWMKWGTTAVTSSNADSIIPAGQICDFYVPKVAATGVLYTAANFIERATTANLVVFEY